jgi:diadenosine tetraphosphate (Ap4A) HIT family hydrolase
VADAPLDRLWAGWRSTYIASAVEARADVAVAAPGNGGTGDGGGTGGPAAGSVFSRILASGLPDEETHVVWRGRLTFAILNAYPYTSGHVLVMPYREVGDLEDLTGEEEAELWSAVRDAVVAIKAAYRPQGINVGANIGAEAGAGVPTHLHVHVLPRWAGDTNFMTSIAQTRVLPEPLDDSWAKLRAAWPSAFAG